MRSKLFILFLMLVAILYIILVPHIILNGPSVLEMEVNSKYKELGINTYSIKNYKVKINSNVNPKKLGTYFVEYKINDILKKTRKVIVVDNKGPEIKLKGNKNTNVCRYETYKDEGYIAIDNYDGDITNKVKTEIKKDKIIYTVEDSNGNKTKKVRNLILKDDKEPIITLNDNNYVYVHQGDEYKDEGAIAIDNCDDNIAVNIINNVNTNELGEYKVIYEAIDKANNKAIVERIVKVIPKEEKTIYLTFDDGPSYTITPQLLDILKEENVKATFFVINHSDDLNYLIKREHDEGHVVALHSFTHNYGEIYASVDAYFNDLNLISNKVRNIIGKEVKLIRFPGGSSNTISSFNPGIMTTLTNEVLNRGYIYFDWNISSGDAGEVYTSDAVYNKVISELTGNNHIVLLHDFESNYKTLNAIRNIIIKAKELGYQFKTLDENSITARHYVNN